MVAIAIPARRTRALAGWPLTAVALGGLTALAAVVRAHALSAPFWIDEGISVGISGHAFTAIPGVLREDGSPPLYYLVLHVWMALFGRSETAVHELSYLFAVLAVPAGWWAASAVFGRLAAGCCAGLIAVSPFVGLYADEARMYSLVVLLGVLVVGAFLRAFVLRRRVHVATFAVVLAALLYTHAWGLFLGASLGVGAVGLIAAGPDRRGLAIDVLIGFGVAGLLYVPWLPTLAYQAAHTAAPWSHRPDARSLQNAVKRMLSGSVPEVLVLVIAAGGAFELLRRSDGVRRRGVLTVLAATAGTLFIAFAWSRISSPAWAVRYFVTIFAPLAVLVGAGLGRMGVLGVAALVVALAVTWHGRPATHTLENKSDVAHVARAIGSDLPRGSVVFSTQPEQVPVLAYYLPPGMRYWTPLGRVRDDGVMDWRNALPRLRAARFAHVVDPLLRQVPIGGRVLLVQPEFSHPDSPWTRRLHHIAHTWGKPFRAHFEVLRVLLPAHGSSRATVTASLLERVRAGARGAGSSSRRHRPRRARAASSARAGARRPARRSRR